MKVSRSVWGLLVLGASAVACNDLFGITILNGSQGEGRDGGGHDEAGTVDEAGTYNEAGTSHEAGPDATDATPPPSVAAITGKEVFYYITDSTMTQVNTDFSAGVVAHFIEADGGITDYPGTGSGDGTFMIPGVPEGEYYVQFRPLPQQGWPLYGYSTSRTIDESTYNYGRPDVAYTDGGTMPVGYDITNVSLVNASYEPFLSAFSIGANAGWYIGCCDGNYSMTFGTTTTGTQWFPEEIPLIKAQSGDITYVLSYQWLLDAAIDPSSSTSPPPMETVQSLQDDSFTMVQGSTSSIAGKMSTPPIATLPDGGAMTLKWDHGSFAAAVGQVGTTAVPYWTELSVGAAPFANLASGFQQYFSSLYFEDLIGNDAENTSIEPISLAYADPFPASWIRYVSAFIIVNTNLDYPLPDGGTLPFNSLVSGSAFCTYNLSDELGQTVQPGIGPPTNIEINGRPANENKVGVGLEPVVSWDPPTLGVPTVYGVNVEDVVVEADLSVITSTVVEMTMTPSIRKVTIPPGILLSDHEYIIQVFASQGPNQDQPGVLGSPSCQANAASALVEPGTSPAQFPDAGASSGTSYDGTTGMPCTTDAQCRPDGGPAINLCTIDSLFSIGAIYPTPVCVSTVTCDPGTDGKAHFCDGPDEPSSPGVCVPTTTPPQSGEGACFPQCDFKPDGNPPTGCQGLDVCIPYSIDTDANGDPIGFGYCWGGCTTSADCSGASIGSPQCQTDQGICVKTLVTNAAPGTSCNATSTTPTCEDCETNGVSPLGYCAPVCAVGGNSCPTGWSCETGLPTSLTNALDATVSGWTSPNPGLSGICAPTCQVDGGQIDDGGSCPPNSSCKSGFVGGAVCFP